MDENTIATCVLLTGHRTFTRRSDLDYWNLFTRYYSQMLLSKADSRSNGRSQFLFIFAGSDSMRGFGQI